MCQPWQRMFTHSVTKGCSPRSFPFWDNITISTIPLPSPLLFGINGLGKNSSQNTPIKWVRGKIFIRKGLTSGILFHYGNLADGILAE